jgi:hypothetical protein
MLSRRLLSVEIWDLVWFGFFYGTSAQKRPLVPGVRLNFVCCNRILSALSAEIRDSVIYGQREQLLTLSSWPCPLPAAHTNVNFLCPSALWLFPETGSSNGQGG